MFSLWILEGWQILLGSVILLFIIKKLLYSGDDDKMPPRVPGLPLVGNAFQINPVEITYELGKLADKYGDLFTISLFGQDIVSVNSAEMMLDLYANSGKDIANRPHANYATLKTMYDAEGFGFRQYSDLYQQLKNISIHAMMMVGEEREQVEQLMQQEAEALVEQLDSYDGKAVNPRGDILDSVANIICAVALGKRFERGDPDLKMLRDWIIITNKIWTPGFGFELDLFPFLMYLPIDSTKTVNKMVEYRDDFIERHYSQLEETYQETSLRCTTDHLFKFQKDHPELDITPKIIKAVMLDLVMSGSLTTTSVLSAAVVILVTHQDAQKKVQEEIDRVVGRSQIPSLKHKKDLHYTQAFIQEVLRYSSCGSAATKATYQQCKIKDYVLPKDTPVFFNFFYANHDSTFWDDPFTFNPERFLDAEKQFLPADHLKRRRVFTFGGGKRVCVGEVFARNRLFLFISLLLQKFSFLPAEGEPIPVHDPRKYVPSLVLSPPPCKICIKRRD